MAIAYVSTLGPVCTEYSEYVFIFESRDEQTTIFKFVEFKV